MNYIRIQNRSKVTWNCQNYVMNSLTKYSSTNPYYACMCMLIYLNLIGVDITSMVSCNQDKVVDANCSTKYQYFRIEFESGEYINLDFGTSIIRSNSSKIPTNIFIRPRIPKNEICTSYFSIVRNMSVDSEGNISGVFKIDENSYQLGETLELDSTLINFYDSLAACAFDQNSFDFDMTLNCATTNKNESVYIHKIASHLVRRVKNYSDWPSIIVSFSYSGSPSSGATIYSLGSIIINRTSDTLEILANSKSVDGSTELTDEFSIKSFDVEIKRTMINKVSLCSGSTRNKIASYEIPNTEIDDFIAVQ